MKQNWFVEEWSEWSEKSEKSGDFQRQNMITCHINKEAKLEVNKALRKAKATYNQLKVSSARGHAELFCIANTLLNGGDSPFIGSELLFCTLFLRRNTF